MKKWIRFYFRWCFELTYEKCGYFDNRPRINLGLIFFHLTIILPFWNKWTDECDPPRYGFDFHHSILWIHKGGGGNGSNKYSTIYMPWKWEWYRTSYLRADKTWEHETPGKLKEFWKDEWDNVLWKETHPYTYILENGDWQCVKATIKLCIREWRLLAFKWIPFINKKSKTIEIDFSDEVGEGVHDWKGGVLGCSYELKKDESPLQALKRMQKERKFS